MTATLQARLQFLQRVITKEIKHLRYSSNHVFTTPFTLEKAQTLEQDPAFAEKLEAYTSRFCRLQDTVGDKLLPTWLTALGETPSAAVNNLDRAEKLGMLRSADLWLEVRQLRNQMIHEYMESLELLTNAIQTAHQNENLLIETAQAILNDLNQRHLL